MEHELIDSPANHRKRRLQRKVKGAATVAKPSWADDLRKLYDDVVAEPLPDSFEDLLKKLDQGGNG